MSISADKIEFPHAETVTITEDTLSVDLSDGRTISVPLAWFPRLLQSTPDERNSWRDSCLTERSCRRAGPRG
ncbi:MAG: hypothetical protein QG591_1533 [Planctomycetota bacterium]|nr:hypothetical protein [Planctomycetota bacterium]